MNESELNAVVEEIEACKTLQEKRAVLLRVFAVGYNTCAEQFNLGLQVSPERLARLA
jgi:hypothetical protein